MDSIAMMSDKEILSLVNKAIQADPFNSKPAELYEPLDYILALGGKRIRPVMLLMATDMFDGDIATAVQAALGIELFHNFSLIHDDIMDNAPIRRGQPTVHEKWNANTAILSGDTMLVKAYEKLLRLPEPILRPALEIFSKTAVEVCEGQQYDMNFERQAEVRLPDYMEMIRLKTAVLIGASLSLGGLIASAPKDDLENLYNFGIHTGLVFQLRDDLLDTYGDEESFGKKQYGDISANKKTYLYLAAYDWSTGNDRKKLAELYSAESPPLQKKIHEILKIFEKADVKKRTEDLIRKHHLLAIQHFSALSAPEDKKRVLLEYTERLSGRSY